MEVRERFEELLREVEPPRFIPVEYRLEQPRIADTEQAVREQLAGCGSMEEIHPGDTVAITAGSREITDMVTILRTVAAMVKERGGLPFIIPAMGSHGGATAEGQEEVLRHFGVTEESTGAPIRSCMDTVKIGETENGFDVCIDKLAFEADHIIPIGRIKAHTDFRGPVESGIMKMIVIGLGKQHGASICHKLGFPNMGKNLLEFGAVILDKAPILLGIGVIENAEHRLALVEAVPAGQILKREPELLELSKSLMPRIPFDNLDVLLISQMGKEISGAGMDPNITGRSCVLGRFWPNAEKIAVLDLTDKSDGNAAGMGNADAITRRMYEKIDFTPIYINGVTCRDTEGIRLPAVMETDMLALKFCMYTCIRRDALPDARIVWIKNTADLHTMYVSEALKEEAEQNGQLRILGDARPLTEEDGNLIWREVKDENRKC